jgi:hypothetical protein
MFLNIFNFIYELQHRLPLGTLSFETKSATVSFSARSKQIKHASNLLIKIKKKSSNLIIKKKVADEVNMNNNALFSLLHPPAYVGAWVARASVWVAWRQFLL